MKEALIQMARYNAWANLQFMAALHLLDHAQLDADVPSSFRSIRKTVAHLRAAEQVWLERLQLAERPVWLGEDSGPSFPDLCAQWTAVSEALLRFAEKQYSDKALLHVVEYRDLKKALHKTPVFGVLQHVFNHSTFHRGQLVTMMRAVGETKIPCTDLIQYLRTGGK